MSRMYTRDIFMSVHNILNYDFSKCNVVTNTHFKIVKIKKL